jgi:hypothetical protein
MLMKRSLVGLTVALLWTSTTPAVPLVDLSKLSRGSNRLSDEVVAAWQKAGAKVGWYGRTRDGGWQFTTGKPDDDNALPAIMWDANREPVGLDKLPAPGVPFALFLDSAPSLPQLTDAGMKDVARFKTLQHLGISGTLVTDAGLKELVALEGSLQCLSLGSAKVTAEGIAQLRKALPKLTIL